MQQRAFSLAELASETGSQLVGDANHLISGAAELECATSIDAAYVADSRFMNALNATHAGVVFITPQLSRPEGKNYLLSDDPALAFQKWSKIVASHKRKPPGFTGIHPTAVIHPTARLGADVTVGPHTVIERDVVIGDRTIVGPLVYIGPEVQVGSNGTINSHVAIHDACEIGNRVVISSGAVIGSVGFGFRQTDKGHHERYEHLGNVVIDDDVEIGANTTIDRARLKSTRIGRGSKIDNQVQVAHNVEIGEDNIIVAQVGIAGSVKTGRWVVLAGRVAVNDHVHLCDKTVIAACSAVLRSITTAGTYMGFPAIPLRRHHRLLICFHNLDKIFMDVQKLKRHLQIEDKDSEPTRGALER